MGDPKKLLDGLWDGLFDVIEATGQSPIPPWEWPWYTVYAFKLHRRFRSIREAASTDYEGMPPPKTYWMDDDKLREWFEDRAEQRIEYGRRKTSQRN